MVNGFISAILSLIIPGLGQLYARDVKRAIIMFVVCVLIHYGCSYLIGYVGYAVPLGFIKLIELLPYLFHVYAAFDAFILWNSAV